MRFDWYQTTIDAAPTAVLESVAKLGHEVRPCDGIARKHRYRQGWAVHHHARGVVATVFAGGNGDKPHAFATSEHTDEFVSLVRELWPENHLVTRMDAAQDFNEQGAYNRLRRVARRVAKAHRMCFAKIEDTLNPAAGRTQYIGSQTSDYRARLYEKGLEVVGRLDVVRKGQVEAVNISAVTNELTGELIVPANWVRLELQARPKGEEARRLAATATPEQAWGFTEWSHELAKEAMALELERIYMRTHKVSKDEEALRWMCQQYGGMLTRLCADLGGWECVGLSIGDTVKLLQGRGNGGGSAP